MAHGDDKGAIIPPQIAPIQIVVIPIAYSDEQRKRVLNESKNIASSLIKEGFRVEFDDRIQYTPGWKFNDWEMKGVPLRIEIGPKDLEKGEVTIARRDSGDRLHLKRIELTTKLKELLKEIQETLFEKTRNLLTSNISKADSYNDFIEQLRMKSGFVKAYWCGNESCEEDIQNETGATIRAIPFKDMQTSGACIYCGKEGSKIVYFAKSY